MHGYNPCALIPKITTTNIPINNTLHTTTQPHHHTHNLDFPSFWRILSRCALGGAIASRHPPQFSDHHTHPQSLNPTLTHTPHHTFRSLCMWVVCLFVCIQVVCFVFVCVCRECSVQLSDFSPTKIQFLNPDLAFWPKIPAKTYKKVKAHSLPIQKQVNLLLLCSTFQCTNITLSFNITI